MTAAKPTAKNYAELEGELREIITWFEGDAFDVDQAVIKYRRGLELVAELETYLSAAENTVRELKATFSKTDPK